MTHFTITTIYTQKKSFFKINVFINHICSLQFVIQYLFKYPSEQIKKNLFLKHMS